MKLTLAKELKMIEMQLTTGETLMWQCNTWSRAKINVVESADETDIEGSVSADLFDTINQYVALLPHAMILEMETIYRQIFEVLSSTEEVADINSQLSDLIYQLLNLVDWRNLKLWCITQSDLNFEIGRKDSISEKHPEGMTFVTADYENLLVFSVLLKLIMPIWGMYFKVLDPILGSDAVLTQAVELIRNPYMDANPAFVRLERYVDVYLKDRIKGSGFSITRNIGADEIPEYMFALALWKKVCIFSGRHPEESIVRNIFNILKDQCGRIERGGPNQKKSKNDREEDISITEMFKIIQKVPLSIAVMAKVYLRKYGFRIGSNHQAPLLTQAEIDTVVNALGRDFDIKAFHIPILGCVCGREISNRSLLLIGYEETLIAIAISSLLLKQWGFPVLSQLLIDRPTVKDVYSFNLHAKPYVAVPVELQEQFNHMYRYCGPYNPGKDKIDDIIKEVNAHTWNVDGLENLPIELTRLLIKKGTE